MRSKHSKRYNTARDQVDAKSYYDLEKAVDILYSFPKAKFDETVELNCHLGVDPRQSTQMVRGVVNLPKGSGKKIRVIVFTDNPEAAKAAGADEAGLNDLIKRVEEGWVDFDVAVATTSAMKEVRRVARVLGPRGLMPNPKSGTVSDDVEKTVKDIKMGGRVEYKMDKTANLGVIIGKRSHSKEDLLENLRAVIEAIGRAKPDGLKGHHFIKNMAVSATMSPSVKLEPAVYSQYN